jgi:hypothetical protein
MKLEKQYKGIHLKATIQKDGSIVVDGVAYDSLSKAGTMARKAVLGKAQESRGPATNGWIFWQYRDPKTGALREINALRKEYLKKR